jgi:glycosyltransferase involved in cell wall biosynthesis
MNSGGAERVAATLANAWVEQGDLVTLVVTFSGRGECFYSLSEKVKLVYLADYVRPFCGRGQAYLARFFALRRLISVENPNVVLSFLTHVNIAVLFAALGRNRRVVVAEHTYPPMVPVGRLWDWFRRKIYPLADGVVMLTSEGLDWLNDRIPSARGAVIPNPVSYPLAASKPRLSPDLYIHAERYLLLAVGRLDRGKQFDLLLDAFRVLAQRYPFWDLVILGDGPERASLEKQVERLGLCGRAFLPGRVGNVGDWYTRAELYVMSSRFEGFPNTLAEAMAYGCAAVSYDCDTGPRDIIRHELDGLLVTPVGDVPALIMALDRLMGDDVERKRMSVQASSVQVRYSLPSIMTMWDRLFTEVI